MTGELNLVADRTKMDWAIVEDMSARIGQSNCLVTNLVAFVVLRMRQHDGLYHTDKPTKAEIKRASRFIDFKIRMIEA